MGKTLLVITGPTGVGKTELCLRLAERLSSPIIGADSRQIYREIPIGTAAPTAQEQERVKHYFVGTKSLTEDYNAGQYERDCLTLLDDLFRERDTLILSGGSMLYIDAVCHGLDDIPAVPESIRREVQSLYSSMGLEWLQQEVQRIDPVYWQMVDRQNPQRLMHCVEVSRAALQPYSSFREGLQPKQRPFRIIKVALFRSRESLYERINARVLMMMEQGLESEARQVMPYRHLNSLNTVGYKEMFRYIDGQWTCEEAIRMIQQNSRHYAKRQLTWFRRDKQIQWLNADDDYEKQMDILDAMLCAHGVQE